VGVERLEAPPVTIPEDGHWWFATRTRELFTIAGALADGGHEVLDLGCGAGNMMHHLARFGTVTGVDNFERALAVARARGYDVRRGEATDLPFPEETFDLVAALDVIEHCADDRAVLAECARVLAPAGHLLVSVPAYPWLWSPNDDLNQHKRRYTAGGLSRRLEEAGFRTVRMTYNNFFVLPPAALLLGLRRLRGRGADLATPSADADAYQVEMEPTAAPVNALLAAIGRLEDALIGLVNLPAGTGLLALAQRS
jgi:SAM-dependent methyltransferase